MSEIRDWFSGAVIWRILEFSSGERELQFLVQKTRATKRQYKWQSPQIKFLGGRSEDHPEDKTPEDTLRRELSEEGRFWMKDDFVPELLYPPELRSNGHQKFFFLVPFDCLSGDLRKDPIRDSNSFLYPPMWRKAFGIEVYKTHRRAARLAVRLITARTSV